MRITGGKARGIQLKVPSRGEVRPATDYIREAVFSSLAAYIPGANVLDLFAGTGAYALESLSRGAQSATCVDLHAGSDLDTNARAVAKSMQAIDLPLKIITGDATKPMKFEQKYDIVFVDPPWDLWQIKGTEISQYAVECAQNQMDTRVILEAPGGFNVPIPQGWKLKKIIGKGKDQPAASILVRESF